MVRSSRGVPSRSHGRGSHGLVPRNAGREPLEADFIDEDGSEVQGVEKAREGILAFLNRTLGTVTVETVTVQLFQLFQQDFQKSAKPFNHFPFNREEDDVEALADEIIETARADISDCGATRIAYSVQIAGHNGRKNFELLIPDNEESGAHDAEMIPTLRHGLTQQMGHNQIMFEVTVGALGSVHKRLAKENERLMERIQYYEAERERYIESREALVSRQHDRDMDLKKQETNRFYMGQIASMGMNTIAPLINNYMKEKFVPVKATPLENMMITLASTIDTPQMQALMKSGILTGPQIQNFLQIVSSINEAAAKEKKDGGFPTTSGSSASGGSTSNPGASRDGTGNGGLG